MENHVTIKTLTKLFATHNPCQKLY